MANRLALASCAALLLLFAPLAQRAQADRAKRTRCANNLRLLALGALSYADDKRFFPHVSGMRDLDGDVTTNHTPKALRLLMALTYLDDPGVFVCPESYDGTPERRQALEDARGWFWGGNTLKLNPGDSPLQARGDPPLNATTELSYGWTRKPMNSNVRSTAVLLADRAVNEQGAENTPLAGNHSDGWNVVHADASASWLPVSLDPFPGSWLTRTEKTETQDAGFLPLKPQTTAAALAKPYAKPGKRPGKLELPKPASPDATPGK